MGDQIDALDDARRRRIVGPHARARAAAPRDKLLR
jgi:hypothetical protein